MRVRYTLMVLVLLLLLALPVTAQDTLPPAQTGRVAFVSVRDGAPALYVMAADGSNMTRLTALGSADGYFDWSPDGTRIVFVGPDANTLSVVDITAGTVQPILPLGTALHHPVWSPDGGRIAFHTNLLGSNDVFTVTPDGATLTNLTQNPADDSRPTWSPDGTRLAFQSDRAGDMDIYVTTADGASVKRLTTTAGVDHDPVWSPDGMRIAFMTERSGNPDVFVIDNNGTNLVQLSDTPHAERDPAWSPDGVWVAYAGGIQPDVTEIVTINANGIDRTQRTTRGAQVGQPAWSPDGEWIIFTGSQNGIFDLYALRVSDGTVTPLPASSPANEAHPRWTAAGTGQAVVAPSPAAQPPTATPTDSGPSDLPPPPTATSGPAIPPPPTATPQAPPSATFAPPTATQMPPTAFPTFTPPPTYTAQPTYTPVPAQPDLLLVYNSAVPSFDLINVSGRELDIASLQFAGNGRQVGADVWLKSGDITSSLTRFARNDCLGLWGLGAGYQPVPPECTTRHSWWESNNIVFWTSGTFTVSYNGRVVAVCEASAGRCPVTLSTTVSNVPTQAPPPAAPPSGVGGTDLLLTYNAAIPSFYLVNTSGRRVNITPLGFEGAGKSVTANIWVQAGMSGSLTDFPEEGCLGLWGYNVPQQPKPVECGFRHGWWESDSAVFWTGNSFTVTYNNSPLATCDTNAGRCTLNLP